MIAWTKKFPAWEKPLGYWRLLRARHRYFDRIGWRRGGLGWILGDQSRIAALRDCHRGQRAFVIANGPSLNELDLSHLRDEVTFGCNGIYKMFPQWGWHVDYLVMEDIEQTELRRKDVSSIQGPLKFFAIYNAYGFPADANTVFFNAPRYRGEPYYWTELYPQFSRDFAAMAHLGSTVTYLMLQLAYHMGCDPVYVIGLDHNYGVLPEQYAHEKIMITEQNIEQVRGLHFMKDYYKPGDPIGVPDVARQEAAYALAKAEYERAGRHIFNASAQTKLNVFERVNYNDLFRKPATP